jgi:hypothetical protein
MTPCRRCGASMHPNETRCLNCGAQFESVLLRLAYDELKAIRIELAKQNEPSTVTAEAGPRAKKRETR